MTEPMSKSSASNVSQVDKDVALQGTSSLNRRRMLGLTVASGIAVAGVVAGRPRAAKAQGWLTLEVKPTFLDIVRTEPAEGDARPTGPFYAEGSLYADGTLDDNGDVPEGAESIGWWRCWGWFWKGGGPFPRGSAQQSFEFGELGEIQTQGKDMATKAVVGGSGAFRGVSGEYFYEDIKTYNSTFRVTFVS
jgi:hypothetical protein